MSTSLRLSLQLERQLGALAAYFIRAGRPDLAARIWALQEVA